MNGAQALIRTLVDCGVDTCFMNPGTSEMHFVAALDDVAEMRGVLALFEGVATGAADGYARMAESRPRSCCISAPVSATGSRIFTTRARERSRSSTSSVTMPRTTSVTMRSSRATSKPSRETCHAGSGRRRVPRMSQATPLMPLPPPWAPRDRSRRSFFLPTSRGSTAAVSPLPTPNERPCVAGRDARRRRRRTSFRRTVCADARRIGAARARPPRGQPDRERDGAKLMCETFPTRLERGAGLPPIDRLPYLGEFAMAQLAGTRHLILADAKAPVSFFAYPNKPSYLVPEGCEVHVLAATIVSIRPQRWRRSPR